MRIKIAGLACVLVASGALAVYAIARPHHFSEPAAPSPSAAPVIPTSVAKPVVTDASAEIIPASQRVVANAASEPRSLAAAAPAIQPQEVPAAAPPPVRSGAPTCANPNALGVARVVEIDTKGGPGFGFEHFKMHDFLRNNEVVLTFDDGPWQTTTPAVLKALADQCVRATFFPIGKHATYYPDILRQVAEAGHSVGSHTWSHQDLSKKTVEQAKEEVEKGISAVHLAVGSSMTPFFRFPALRHPPEMVTYLGERNVAIFSTDLDSFDFKTRKKSRKASAPSTWRSAVR